MKKPEILTFRIPTYLLPPLINGDNDGLSEDEEIRLDEWCRNISITYGVGHWALTEDEPSFYHSNDFENLGADCVDINYVIMRP